MALRIPERRVRRRRLRPGERVREEDPLAGLANLFDLGMVFAVALLLAMVKSLSLSELLTKTEEVTIVKNPGRPDMEIIRKKGIKLERLRLSTQEIGGEGERLGTAYRLKSGEVVYVPEKPSGRKGGRGRK